MKQYTLWKTSNGWILVPEGVNGSLTAETAEKASVFKTLEEFSGHKPKRVRNRKAKPTPTTKEN